VPVVLLSRFLGTIDDWDPEVLTRRRAREIVIGFPDPGQDDGRRLLSDVATAMGADLDPYDARTFLVESGILQERCPAVAGQADAATYISTALLDLVGRSS
jgi:hypothetical protein